MHHWNVDAKLNQAAAAAEIPKLHTKIRHTNYSATDNWRGALINQTRFFSSELWILCFMVFLIISLYGK